MADLVGEHGEGDVVEDILQGTFIMAKEMREQPDAEELEEFIKALQIPLRDDGSPLPPVKGRFTQKEYQAYFRKKRENTASAPPIHIGHHKVAAECFFSPQ